MNILEYQSILKLSPLIVFSEKLYFSRRRKNEDVYVVKTF